MENCWWGRFGMGVTKKTLTQQFLYNRM
jgi:hypothetical protein